MSATIWTISAEVSLKYLPKINTGGRPLYGGLEIIARPAPEIVGMEAENQDDQTPDSAKWFANIREGFDEYFSQRESQGRPIGGVRIFVTRLYVHPVDTYDFLMTQMGKAALRQVFEKNEVEITNPEVT